jgi:penicillin-binding protein 1A
VRSKFYRRFPPAEPREWSQEYTDRTFFFSLAGFTVFYTLFLGWLFFIFGAHMPELKVLETYQPSQVTTLYDDHNQSFAQFYEERRMLVPLAAIPRELKQAILAVEDARFYRHKGIDLRAIYRALWTNIRAGHIVQGASTITQQLSKVIFLKPEKSISRKTKEALLAIQIERKYTKDQILELYCNQIYFGHGAYGVEAAARTFFKKPVSQLNLSECAFLAGMPRSPQLYSPIYNPERAKRRKAHVLTRMVEEGFITKEQAKTALERPYDPRYFNLEKKLAPFFVEYIRIYLEDKYGTEALYRGGLHVYTTLNVNMQKAAQEAFDRGIREYDKRHGFKGVHRPKVQAAVKTPSLAEELFVGKILKGRVTKVSKEGIEVHASNYLGLIPPDQMTWARINDPQKTFRPGDYIEVRVVSFDEKTKKAVLALEQEPGVEGAMVAIEPQTGYIKAMIGGYDFRRSQFNRATQAKRQPGSAFKPFVYAAAIDNHFAPTDILKDEPIIFPAKLTGTNEDWEPQNYDRIFEGPVTLRHALEHSRNVPTIRLLQLVGVETVRQLATRMGISSHLGPHYSLAIGTSEVTLLEITSSFGVFATGGVRAEPFAIRMVKDREGNILESTEVKTQEVLSPQTAYVTTYMMKGVIQRGTGARASALGRPLAGKTGTTQEFTDAWFLGFSPRLAAGVWVGYDAKKTLGEREAGAAAALPIWMEFMKAALEGTPAEDFAVPEGITFVEVDRITGKLATPACKDVIKEAFIKGTEPTQKCNAHGLLGS